MDTLESQIRDNYSTHLGYHDRKAWLNVNMANLIFMCISLSFGVLFAEQDYSIDGISSSIRLGWLSLYCYHYK